MGAIDKHIDSENNLTEYTVNGEITAGDVSHMIHQFYQGTVTLNVLWDLTRSDVRRIKSYEVKEIAKIPRERHIEREGGKTAIVAPNDMAFGLARMYELINDLEDLPFQTRTFRSIEEARQWLLANE